MVIARRVAATVARMGRRAVRELHWAMPGGPGHPAPWAELDDHERIRRQEREAWRQGADED